MFDNRLNIGQLGNAQSLKSRAYDALKSAITSLDIYAPDAQLKLDERDLSSRFGISRTPLREALALLEREGILSVVPRRGVYIVRKSRDEILDMITVWAALESMAARLAVAACDEADFAVLHDHVRAGAEGGVSAHAEANIRFHQAILKAGGNAIVDRIAEELLFHVRAVRRHMQWDEERRARSLAEHRNIVSAIEMRDADEAERLVREHTLRMRDHIARSIDLH